MHEPGPWSATRSRRVAASSSAPRGPTRGGGGQKAKEAKPDVCLLDINMPGNGISAAAEITTALPGTAVVMLTVSRHDEDLFDALRAGASGYLLKGLDEGSSGEAVQRVLAGQGRAA